jgi:signal transduction histidine kinase
MGFAVDQAVADEAIDRGFGLVSMKERVHFSGGNFVIESSRGQGTTISAQWPVPA